jgi:predicted secreted protein
MKQGIELLKKLDPDGKYATRGYYTYPIYSESSTHQKASSITGWRVGQYLDLTTQNITQLASTVASVQQVLALNGLNFGLSDETAKKLEAKRLESAYKNLQERLQIMTKIMGKNVAEVTIESLDIDGVVNHFQPQPMFSAAAPMLAKTNSVQETSFEPGETVLSATVLAKIKFDK